MVTRIFLSAFFLCVVSFVSAQSLVVYHVSGNVMLMNGSQKKIVTRGTALAKNSVLQLRDGAACMLIGAKGQSLQLEKAGDFTMAKLQQMLAGAKQSSVSGKFFAYVYDNLVKKTEKISLNITPVVYRAEALMKSPKQYQVLTYSDHIRFQWRKPTSTTPVRVQLFTDKDSIIVDSIFKQTQEFILPVGALSFQKNHLYKWLVEEQYNPAKTKNYFYFVLVDDKDFSAFRQTEKIIGDSRHSRELKSTMRRDLMLKALQ